MSARGAPLALTLHRACIGRRPRALLALALAAVLTACASRPPVGADQIAGRLSLRVAATAEQAERAATMGFELRGSPQAGEIDFTTPLGSMVAQARWSPGRVSLITPQGEREFDDLDALSRDALGEVLPVAALFDWLRGRPWAGAAHQSLAAGAGFEQLGWQVDLARFPDGLVVARRDQPPAVTVRAALNRP